MMTSTAWTSSSALPLKCWACAWSGRGQQHANQQLAAGTHPEPPAGWLAEHGLRYCASDLHPPWVHCGRECLRCRRAAGASRQAPPPASSVHHPIPAAPSVAGAAVAAGDAPLHPPQPAPKVAAIGELPAGKDAAGHRGSPGDLSALHLRQWLQQDSSLEKVEAAVLTAATARPRRYLPRSACARQLAASIMLDVATLARDGCAAAQALLPWAPRVLLARDAPISSQVSALLAGRAAEAPPQKPPCDPTLAYHARVRSAVAMADLRALNRLLAEGAAPVAASRDAIGQVIETKFPLKLEGELPDPAADEDRWISQWTAGCGGHTTAVSQREVVRWARAKRDRAADAGGYSGRLILELHSTDPAVTAVLAAVWSMDPAAWVHRGGAFATWRVLRAAFIPQQQKPLPRPVATAPVARRAWGSAAIRRVRDAAARFCEDRGQFGLSRADGQTAYAIAARVFHGLGGDVAVDDRSNSFHELHRSSVFSGVSSFLSALPPESLDSSGRPLVDVLTRTFAGPPPPEVQDRLPSVHQAGACGAAGARDAEKPRLLERSRYVFPDGIAPRTHHALCQGSSESSLLEAVTYAQDGWRAVQGGVRCELHDDGYTAALPTAPVGGFARPPSRDGSLIATGKDIVVGPRAQMIVDAGHSRTAAPFVFVAGIPVGDTVAALHAWRERYSTKLSRIREMAQIDTALAATAAMAIGGPAGLANHILRAVQPTPQILALWREIDDQWVDLWLDLLRLDRDERTATVRDIVRTRLFLRRGACGLGMRGAEEAAEVRYAEGVGDAAFVLAGIVGRSGTSVESPAVWDAIGATAWRAGLGPKSSSSYSARALREAAQNRARAAAAMAEAADEARYARVVGDPAYQHGPRERAAAGGPPNLLVTWLRRPRSDATVRMQPADAVVALRRLFGLPVSGHATGILVPLSCARCNAPAISIAGGTGDERPRRGPRGGVDCYGEHALACARSRGDTQRRHNEMAHAIRTCIAPAGWSPDCRGGPIFEGHGGRPADIWVARHPRYAAGQALDCTVVTTEGREPGAAVAAAEEAKRSKYAKQVERSPGMGFAPLAFDLLGSIGPSAWAEITSWARARAMPSSSECDYPEALSDILATLAHALVEASVRHIRAYDNDNRRDPPRGSVEPPRSAASQRR